MALIISISLIVTLLAPFVAQAAPLPPVLLSPANGTTTTVANYPPQAIPIFQWQAVGGATPYRIQFSNNIGFSPVQFEATTATNSIHTYLRRDILGRDHGTGALESTPPVSVITRSRGSSRGVGVTPRMRRLCYRQRPSAP